MRRLAPLPGLLATLVLASSAASQALYRWVDEDGNVHYSDRPPPEAVSESEQIQVDAGISPQRRAEAERRLDAQQRSLEANRARRDELRTEAAERAATQRQHLATRDRLCAEARRNLATLVQGGPVYRVNAAGEREYLPDNQRDAEIARYRQAVSAACQ